jgi:CheY-like chemotaxis protein
MKTVFWGMSILQKKASVNQKIAKNSRFNTAIDNPFKIKIEAQMVIPVVFDDKVEGMIRCSKKDQPYSQRTLEIIKRITNSFKDIFLHERHHMDMEMQRHPFSLETVEVYKSIKEVKKTYEHLLLHTQNPEIEKLLKEEESTIDSVFQYLNPNMENVSRVKKQLQQFKKNENDSSLLKVLIADDVLMNVKILNSMLSHDDQISEIQAAYDGNQTLDMLEKTCATNDRIDVFFLDHHMPGKLGLDIAEALKNDSRCNTLIVSITNDPDAIKNHMNLYDYHLSKPFSKVAIETIVNKIKDER